MPGVKRPRPHEGPPPPPAARRRAGRAADPLTALQVFIPTLGRAARRGGTALLLAQHGVRCTLVVEPHERADYGEAFSRTPHRVAALPSSHQGIAYARNFISSALAPAEGWWAMLDDDINRFYRAAGNGKVRGIGPADALREMLTEAEAAPAAVRLIALEYKAWVRAKDPALNRRCTVCLLLRGSPPPGVRWRFRVREDYDYALQLIRGGYSTLRVVHVGFGCPQMGSVRGGMHDFYSRCHREHLVHTTAFLKAWGGVACKSYRPGGRLDVHINWHRLGKGWPDPEPTGQLEQRAAPSAGGHPRAIAVWMGEGALEEGGVTVRRGWWRGRLLDAAAHGMRWVRWDPECDSRGCDLLPLPPQAHAAGGALAWHDADCLRLADGEDTSPEAACHQGPCSAQAPAAPPVPAVGWGLAPPPLPGPPRAGSPSDAATPAPGERSPSPRSPVSSGGPASLPCSASRASSSPGSPRAAPAAAAGAAAAAAARAIRRARRLAQGRLCYAVPRERMRQLIRELDLRRLTATMESCAGALGEVIEYEEGQHMLTVHFEDPGEIIDMPSFMLIPPPPNPGLTWPPLPRVPPR
eukprot:TRINITY_DN1278_c1_g1_i1.p1 TRINITY_DN1278_c1_g1~~TRINITY_DN1278_c1_g1_i1.p1  ORF type:complete len:602 (+),score=149.12 TRINITY_DN1278_c1_g1_i1:65-1807(+)